MEGIAHQNGTGSEHLENSQAIHISKNEKAHSEETSKAVAGQSPSQEIIHGAKQPFQ